MSHEPAGPPVPILLYHSVGHTSSAEYRRWCVDPVAFSEQLDVLVELGLTCLTVTDFVDRRRAGTLPERPALITFDDGRADVVEHAAPTLEAHRLPATVYVVSGHLGGHSSWLDDPLERAQPMMSWQDARDLDRAGVEIGSHSVTHRELDVLASAEVRREIVGSRDHIAEQLGRAVSSFAYPHGYHTAGVVREVRRAGFTSACAVKDCWSPADDDAFALSRLIVGGELSTEAFRALLAGDVPIRTHPEHGELARLGWRALRWARQRRRAAA